MKISKTHYPHNTFMYILFEKENCCLFYRYLEGSLIYCIAKSECYPKEMICNEEHLDVFDVVLGKSYHVPMDNAKIINLNGSLN